MNNIKLSKIIIIVIFLVSSGSVYAEKLSPKSFIIRFSLPDNITRAKDLPVSKIKSVRLTTANKEIWRANLKSTTTFPINDLNGWGQPLHESGLLYRNLFSRYPKDRHSVVIAERIIRILPNKDVQSNLEVYYLYTKGPDIPVSIFDGKKYVLVGFLTPHNKKSFVQFKIPLRINEIFPEGLNTDIPILNKEFIDVISPSKNKIQMNGRGWKTEIPPYYSNALWEPTLMSRRHIDSVKRELHEAMYFNNKENFFEFTGRYKDKFKTWIQKAHKSSIEGGKLSDFIERNLKDSFNHNQNYLKKAYPGLDEKKYKVLNIMNLVHGYYDFDSTFSSKKNSELNHEPQRGDCSEIANLISNLLVLEGIPSRIMGYSWNFDSFVYKSTESLGPFISGHQIVQAEGLFVDGEINTSFNVGDKYNLASFPPENRLDELANNKRIYGFYDWYLNPDVRKMLIANKQDPGVIAFFYYYYFYGLDKSNTYSMPYIPVDIFKVKKELELTIELPSQNKLLESVPTHSICKETDQKYLDIWVELLNREVRNLNILNSPFILSSYADYVTYQCKVNKIHNPELYPIIFEAIDTFFSMPVVFEGRIKGWGKPYKIDIFNDGLVNPPNTKYVLETQAYLSAIYEALLSVDSDPNLSATSRKSLNEALNKANQILDSWDAAYIEDSEKLGWYWYSEYKHDAKFITNTNSGMGFVWLLRYKLTGENKAINRAISLAKTFFSYSTFDPFDPSALVWPAGEQNMFMQNSESSITDFGFLTSLIQQGIISNWTAIKDTVNNMSSGDIILQQIRYLNGMRIPSNTVGVEGGIMYSLGKVLGVKNDPALEDRLRKYLDAAIDLAKNNKNQTNNPLLIKALGLYLMRSSDQVKI